MIEKILKEINRLKKELDGYSASEALDYIEAYINAISKDVSEDLGEELDNFLKDPVFGKLINCNAGLVLARHFAEWQREKDQQTIELAEDHAMLAGMEKMREEMMKNTVLETKVMKDSDGDGIETPYEEWLTLENTEIPYIPDNLGLKEGDKVKIIILKTE